MIKNNIVEYISEKDNGVFIAKESGVFMIPELILSSDALIDFRDLINEVIADNGGSFQTRELMVETTPDVPPVRSGKPPLIA